jgi:mRNA-degrading endonuclease RelE of RelBE toxin-antitoxin system
MADTPPERTVRAVPRFIKSKRRLTPAVQTEIDDQVKALVGDPFKGEPKKGALSGVRVVKFKGEDQQYLLAYYFHVKANVVELLNVGVHENFYRRLEGYLKDR